MQLLNSIGLALDFAGVLLLGYDLVRVQSDLRESARKRLDAAVSAAEIADEAASAASKFGLDHRHYDLDEGRPYYFEGTFDVESAREAEAAAVDAITGISSAVQKMADLTSDQAALDDEAASKSLVTSYIGLTFVAVGFAFQLLSNLLT